MEDVHPEVLAQYEDVRRSGQCNMMDKQCVKHVARAKGHAMLVRFINNGRYRELLSGYDRREASSAHEDFDFTGGP